MVSIFHTISAPERAGHHGEKTCGYGGRHRSFPFDFNRADG